MIQKRAARSINPNTLLMKITLISLTILLMAGCTYYKPAPAPYSTTVKKSKFDQSWSAAIGALADQGVQIGTQDRSAGVIQGTRNDINITANIRTQADGSVRVAFNTSGATQRDPTFIDRVISSYNHRMGR